MHNCKAIRDRLAELGIDRNESQSDQVLRAEVLRCVNCREEFASLEQTLAAVTQAMETMTPPEDYWAGYHARLRHKLKNPENESPSKVTRFLTASIRVPVPVGIALLFMLGTTLFLAIRSDSQSSSSSFETSSVVHVPVQVPIIQERIVTRVVYRETKSRTTGMARRKDTGRELRLKENSDDQVEPSSLAGFKPLDEVRLRVIKGGSLDEN
ncbi:MAG TPA: hypothetical protein VJ023_17380 [Pyrinomonadaceae bacterium]|nr:hypothetical protein [Pyrinomonadaceae bacterium]